MEIIEQHKILAYLEKIPDVMTEPIKAIIIDDNKMHISSLMILLQRHCPQVEIVDTSRSAAEGKEAIQLFNPDLVFLDIQMETPMAGFELLEQIPDRDFDVIFTTQHDMHALRAFEAYPIDFLVKPVDPDRLVKAMRLVLERKVPLLSGEMLTDIKDVYQNPDKPFPKIPVPTMEGSEFIKVADIIRCQAATEKGNRTLFYLKNQRNPILSSKTLKDVETDLLKGQSFCRIHQSHLVNRVHMTRYIKDGGQSPKEHEPEKKAAGGYVIMADNAILPVSKSGKKRLFGKA